MRARTVMPPWDSTVALRRDPYRFVRTTCGRLGTDAIETRLLLQPALLMTGAEAARFFYDPTLFRRQGAAPGFLKATLFGRGGVQGLDNAAHRHRKAMFLDLLGPGRTDDLTRRAVGALDGLAARKGPLQDRLELILTEAVCGWAGVPLAAGELPSRARMLSDLFEYAGSVGLGQIRARFARRRADRWAEDLVEAARSGRLDLDAGQALARVAAWRDEAGALLPRRVAAVELLNVLRPFVAISVYLTFAAHALATQPGEADRLRADPRRLPWFVQEVRRLYPFFPLVAARAAVPSQWRGHAIPEGRLVALDLWGTSRDSAAWDHPDAFRPERFEGWRGDPFTLVPQGGGEHAEGHRCPGEWVTRDLMEAGTARLLHLVDWAALPPQDLSLDMASLPGLPRSRVVLLPD